MRKKELFNNEIAQNMYDIVFKQQTKISKNELNNAIDNINYAAELFEESGLYKQADQLINLMQKIAAGKSPRLVEVPEERKWSEITKSPEWTTVRKPNYSKLVTKERLENELKTVRFEINSIIQKIYELQEEKEALDSAWIEIKDKIENIDASKRWGETGGISQEDKEAYDFLSEKIESISNMIHNYKMTIADIIYNFDKKYRDITKKTVSGLFSDYDEYIEYAARYNKLIENYEKKIGQETEFNESSSEEILSTPVFEEESPEEDVLSISAAKRKNKLKKPNGATKGLTSKKMVENLKQHGHPLNLKK